ncbi:hypothetical protein Hypma_004166 [Hypsizygus marmoreus]|uniref:DUF6830 domain-containing protein n=1 Tax=Hypsizygus marmoreus TaxID=39966 RepID=A0A369J0H7_HYPMA|nr:hypothetical protein Hypma_004166 [Hypsizygus marmoreus]
MVIRVGIASLPQGLVFRYLGQAPEISEAVCDRLTNALTDFHRHKKAIIAAGARTGKGNRVINNWYIPKLEFMQSVVTSIRGNGVPIQWSADPTERAHITEIKEPSESTNNQNYESQICRHLDRIDKCRRFDLATAIREARIDIRSLIDDYANDEDGDEFEPDGHITVLNTTATLLSNISPVSQLTGTTRRAGDYYALALALQQEGSQQVLHPLRTFIDGDTAIHLSRDPSHKRMSVDEISEKFKLPDLRGALSDYLNHINSGDGTVLEYREAGNSGNGYLPFDLLEVWNKVRVQNRSYFAPHSILPAQTINASPPSDSWLFGRHDVVLINVDSGSCWPCSGLDGMSDSSIVDALLANCETGHLVAQLQLVFRVVPPRGTVAVRGTDNFLTYVQRFDIIPQINRQISGSSTRKGLYPDPASGMYLMERARRNDGSLIGGIVPLAHVRTLVDLVPDFGESVADVRLTKETTLHYCSQFWLNKYFDKETYYAMSLL